MLMVALVGACIIAAAVIANRHESMQRLQKARIKVDERDKK